MFYDILQKLKWSLISKIILIVNQFDLLLQTI